MPSHIDVAELPEVLTPGECVEQIARAENLGFVAQHFRGPEHVEVRNRVAIDDDAVAAFLWDRLAPQIPPLLSFYRPGLRPDPDTADLHQLRAMGLNRRMRYYKYSGGERFAPHVDLSHSEGSRRSFLTLIIYLNDDFQGGETDFFTFSVAPRTGKAIAFAHELRHEGKPVFCGTKYVLRTDVMYEEFA
jgi:prolyl 4-hydroxylase